MDDENKPECELRRRRSSNRPLNLDVGFQVNVGGPNFGTPSPSTIRFIPDGNEGASSSALTEFRKKQQSFEVHIEECEEEEIMLDSDGEMEADIQVDRPVTPIPIQDFPANVNYTEDTNFLAHFWDEEVDKHGDSDLSLIVDLQGPQLSDFLQVKVLENDCITDVSDAESEEE